MAPSQNDKPINNNQIFPVFNFSVCPNMTEKLKTGMLNLKTTNKPSLALGITHEHDSLISQAKVPLNTQKGLARSRH